MTLAQILTQLKLPAKTKTHLAAIEVPRENLALIATKLSQDFKLPLSLMYATDERESTHSFYVHVVFAIDSESTLLTLRTAIPKNDPSYPSLTRTVMAAHWYERLIGDQFGIVAVGHPDWRRLMHHENIPANTYPLRKDFAWNTKLPLANEPYPMHTVEGKGIYQIPVGPIHAGIIEPGHFRFNVRGERILTLEGKLFFKHKGVEKLLEGKTPLEAMPFIEGVSGNMPIAHSIAFCESVERIANTNVPPRARYLRTFLNELERVAMHIFDLGNIGGNGTGFTFAVAQGFRIHELVRRLNEQLVDHRFLYGVIIPGGLARDISNSDLQNALTQLAVIEQQLDLFLKTAYATDGLMERLETTGVLTQDAAIAYGGVGLPTRASGSARDIRHNRPYAAYKEVGVNIVTLQSGDVRARFDARVKELAESFRILQSTVKHMPAGPIHTAPAYKAGSAYGWAEGWLGEVIDWVNLNGNGTIERCVIRDPSFCNWPLFSEVGPGNIVPDFPLCNKSFNLSYSGTDL